MFVTTLRVTDSDSSPNWRKCSEPMCLQWIGHTLLFSAAYVQHRMELVFGWRV